MITAIAGFSIWSILTPAVVASIATLYFNFRAEKRRAERDFITKSFDTAKEDVRRGVDAAAEYFPLSAAERCAPHEAKLWVGERDVRHSIETLIAFSDPACGSRRLLQEALDDFVDSLTGGSFGSADATADLDQVRKVASTGAKLRSAISTARQLELSTAVDSDLISRATRAALTYMKGNLGPSTNGEQPQLPMSLPKQAPPKADSANDTP